MVRRRGERNTYGLPQGTAIRLELKTFFSEQRRAVLRWLATGETRGNKYGYSDEGPDRIDRPDHHVRVGDRIPDPARIADTGLATKDDPPIPAGFPSLGELGLGDEELADRMIPLLQLVWDSAADGFAGRLGLDPDAFRVDNPKIGRAVEEAALAFSEKTNETTSLALDDALAEVRASILAGNTGEGLSYDDLTDVINSIFDEATRSRARRIAVTESSRAVHSAQELMARESGVVTGWRWLLSSDACPMCQTIARRCPFVRLGQPFAVIGDDPNYSTIKFPPAHPHCQCTMVEVLDIDEQPEWSETLIQPRPELEDYPPDEAPESLQEAA